MINCFSCRSIAGPFVSKNGSMPHCTRCVRETYGSLDGWLAYEQINDSPADQIDDPAAEPERRPCNLRTVRAAFNKFMGERPQVVPRRMSYAERRKLESRHVEIDHAKEQARVLEFQMMRRQAALNPPKKPVVRGFAPLVKTFYWDYKTCRCTVRYRNNFRTLETKSGPVLTILDLSTVILTDLVDRSRKFNLKKHEVEALRDQFAAYLMGDPCRALERNFKVKQSVFIDWVLAQSQPAEVTQCA